MTARRFARKPESHKSTHPKFWWKPHARKLAAVLGGKTRTEVREQAHKQTKTTTIPLKATPNPVKGLLLRGVDEFPFINGRPAKRKLKAVEYEVLKFMAGKHADGYQRLFYADIDVGIYKSRTRALRFLAEDPEFGPFVSVPGSRKNKNKGYALIGVQVF